MGFTHVALAVRDVEASIGFYSRYANMHVVHRRSDGIHRVVWLSDLTRPFVVVLLESEGPVALLQGSAHLGIGCASREAVDRLCELARREQRLALGPTDSGPPVGYWAIVRDPDGHNLELSYGQEVGLAVREAGDESEGPARP